MSGGARHPDLTLRPGDGQLRSSCLRGPTPRRAVPARELTVPTPGLHRPTRRLQGQVGRCTSQDITTAALSRTTYRPGHYVRSPRPDVSRPRLEHSRPRHQVRNPRPYISPPRPEIHAARRKAVVTRGRTSTSSPAERRCDPQQTAHRRVRRQRDNQDALTRRRDYEWRAGRLRPTS